MKYKIGVWGQFGNGGKIADGQAVRTTIITNELKNKYGADNIGVLNTNGWNLHPFRFLYDSIKLIYDSQVIIIAPADNGYKIFVPILIFCNFFFNRRLLHVVIGGFLPSLIKRCPIYRMLENRFDAVFVQTENIKSDLSELGVRNLFILSNLKRLQTLSPNALRLNASKTVSACMLSRLNKEKGVEDAIDAVNIVNGKLGFKAINIDLYGMIQPGYEERLAEIISSNQEVVTYKGIVDYDKTVEVMSKYFVLLFPTYYYGEGFPGNVVDAYNSGLPIIATDWLYNKDVIMDGRNGILVKIQDPKSIADALLELYNDRDLHFSISQNNLEDSSMYAPNIVLRSFYHVIDDCLSKQHK